MIMRNKTRERITEMYLEELKIYQQKEKELYELMERLNSYIEIAKDFGGIISKDETMEKMFKILDEKYFDEDEIEN